MSDPDERDQQRGQSDPVAVVANLVSYAVAEVRRLPAQAVRLPLLALNYGLAVADRVIREYDGLREKVAAAESADGSADGSADEPADEPAQDGTPKRKVAGFVTPPSEQAGTANGAAPEAAKPAKPAKPAKQTDVASSAPATPAARRPTDTAVSSDVQREVDALAAARGDGGPLEHDALPLPDFDHMTLGSLRGRLRTLSKAQLLVLRDYERAHADRLPVVTMLDNRIAKLAAQVD